MTSQTLSYLPRPPVVAVLGHVDHGKTTLLDAIRKTNAAASEYGGITQAIGASQIEVKREGSRYITFLDTPGHETFAKMRARGAAVADIAILVVAADDSVKPQTIESIEHVKRAGIPMIVAISKVDLPTAHVEAVKRDLMKHGVQLEGFGGDVPFVPISSPQGKGVRELLDLILLVADMKELKADPSGAVEVVVIETRIDKGKGMVSTLIVRNGTLVAGTPLYDGSREIVKVRAMFDEHAQSVSHAPPGKPVEVLGFRELPAVGTTLWGRPKETPAAVVSSPRVREMPDFLQPIDAQKAEDTLRIILKSDTAGSLEAISMALPEKVTVVQRGVGDITQADVLAAKTMRAIIVGFNVGAGGSVLKLAKTEKVLLRTYRIIYELLDELKDVVEGFHQMREAEHELGRGTIIAAFPVRGQRVAGTSVLSGRLARGDTVKIMRANAEVARAKIKSLRHGKEDISRADTGSECGILFDRNVDFAVGDGIIAWTAS